jgi:hypothetical protein
MSNSRRGLTARQPLGPKRGRADLKHLRAMTEAEIRRTTPPELANLPRDFWKDAKLVVPRGTRSRKPKLKMRGEVMRPPPSIAWELGGPTAA